MEICVDSTIALPEKIKEVYIEEGIEVIGENCFSGLPFIADVYLPKSIRMIENGAFRYFEKSRYVKDVPALCVHYHDAMPPIGENVFVRNADKEEYEDYSDWGDMYVGTTHLSFDVVYLKNE